MSSRRLHRDGDDADEFERTIAVKFTNIRTYGLVLVSQCGIFVALLAGIIFCTEHLRDTLLIRPHPALWRAATGVGLFYFMFVIFLLFQEMPTIQTILQSLDPELPGKPLPERSYAEDCSFTWEAFKPMLFDRFVVAHFFGWWAKTLMLRDPILCHILSFSFEIMEVTFTYLQRNFHECALDHWVLDLLLCNGGGILAGTYTLRLLNSKRYDWGGVYPTIGSKLRRGLAQFTPHSWTPYHWQFLHSFPRFGYAVGITLIVLTVELNAFFLKDLLWVPPESPLNIWRLVIWFLLGNIALKDTYHFAMDPTVKRFGPAAWLAAGTASAELIIIYRFAVTKYSGLTMPLHIKYSWWVGGTVFAVGTAWWFLYGKHRYLKPKAQ